MIEPNEALEERLRHAGLRPTRQRVALASLIFGAGDRHLSAEELHEEAVAASIPVSLATVYNTLHQFTEARMLRILAMEGSKTYFDTNVDDHHHFFIEGENRVLDIPMSTLRVEEQKEDVVDGAKCAEVAACGIDSGWRGCGVAAGAAALAMVFCGANAAVFAATAESGWIPNAGAARNPAVVVVVVAARKRNEERSIFYFILSYSERKGMFC